MIRKSITFAAVCLVLISAVVMAPGVSAQPSGDGPGNSANAKLCQKDGWKNLARLGSSGVPFASQDECVSFGAEGGEIVPMRGLIMTWEPSEDTRWECRGFVTFTGFEPGTYQYTLTWDGGGGGSFIAVLTVDSDPDTVTWGLANSYYGVHTIMVEDVSVATTPSCPSN